MTWNVEESVFGTGGHGGGISLQYLEGKTTQMIYVEQNDSIHYFNII